MIKAVFFDLYNTLVDYDPPREELQAATLRQMGMEAEPEALRRAIQLADQFYYEESARLPVQKRSAAEKTDLYAEYQSKVLAGVGIKVTKEVALQVLARFGAMLRQSGAKLVLFPDVVPALAQLKSRGLTLGLITNVDRDMSPTFDELGLSSYLDFMVISFELGVAKPDPAIFRAALERAAAKPAEAIHVGDQYHADVLGARSAGIKPLLLDRDNFNPQFTDCIRISSLEEVVRHLQ